MIQLEQDVAALKNALVVAMEEVDQLRSQMFAETGKLQREFRDSVDAVVKSSTPVGQQRHHVQRLFDSPQTQRDASPKLEYLELAVRALQERRDSTPAAVDALMNQMRRWTENADNNARQLEHRVADALSSHESKVRAWVEERTREAEQSTRRTIIARLDQQETLLREQDSKLAALTTVVGNLDKRLHAAEEGLSQLDTEQHDVTNALQGLRDQQRSILRSPNRRNEDIEAAMNEHSHALKEEVRHVVDSRLRQSPPQLSNALTGSLEQRAMQQDVQVLRQDVARCVGTIERLMEEQQRLSQSQHASSQSVQRVEQLVDGARDRLELDLKTELQRFDTLQKTFFSRQEQLLNSERHQLGVKVTADLQRMHQRQMEELQKSELRRFDDIRAAQTALREEMTGFVDRQRDETNAATAASDDRLRRTLEELKVFVQHEVSQQTDVAKKSTVQSVEDMRKVSTRTMDELKRVKQLLDDQSTKHDDQSKFFHARVQQILDAEVHRFDQIAFEFSAKLQRQVDEEVTRVVGATEGLIGRDLESHKDMCQRELKTLRDDIMSMRSSLQAIAAPSNAIGSIDSRVDVLRRDVLNLHDAIGKVHEQETRIQSNIVQDTRILVESLRADVLRDVGQHIIRFDQALVELAQENAAMRSRLANYEVDDVPVFPIGAATSSSRTVAGTFGNDWYPSQHQQSASMKLSKGTPPYPGTTSPHNTSSRVVSGTSTPQPGSPRDFPLPPQGHGSIFGQRNTPASNTQQPSSTSGRPLQSNYHPSSRLESPDRGNVVDRGGHYPPREDPLIGVFEEYQGSP